MSRKRIPFRTLRHALTVPAVKLVVFCSAATPAFVSRIFARLLGTLLSALSLPSNRVIDEHRRSVMALNSIDVSTSSIYAGITAGFLDFFRLSYRSDKTFLKSVSVKGIHNMEKALSYRKGVIAVTAHCGAWELLPRALKLQGFDLGVIGRSLNMKGASEVLEKLRRKPGVETIDRDAGVGPLLRILRRNGIAGILIDQDTKGVQSEFADFLGCPARTPVAPAVLSVRLGVPVVTMHISRKNKFRYLVEIDEPVFFTESQNKVQILTELNKTISSWILDAPDQWVWFHKRWHRQPVEKR